MASALDGRAGLQAGWGASVVIYAAFAAAIFGIQGPEPLLGADHISYIKLADTIYTACGDGGYWRELNSVRTLGVLLASLQDWTGSYVLSMKLVLAAFSVPYLLASELLFREFAGRWQAVLFALVSSFAVSFGIASWGITDSTALLARTLVAPVLMLAAWIWFHYDGRPAKYLAFPLLVLGSVLHLSAFYLLGVLVLVEIADCLFLRCPRLDRRLPTAALILVASAALLLGLETVGISSQLIGVQVPNMLRSLGFDVQNFADHQPPGCHGHLAAGDSGPAASRSILAKTAQTLPAAAPPAVLMPAAEPVRPPDNAAEAWRIELALRPWRNMPLPLVNLANVLSSSALVLMLAIGGVLGTWRSGFTRADRVMLAMLLAVPAFAFGPQTLLWVLRSFTSIYPTNIEEVRSISLVMIPAFYFVLRLFQLTLASGGPRRRAKAAAIIVAALALPLVMKGLPQWTRETILSAMLSMRVIDPASESAILNARAALGLAGGGAPLYYGTRDVRRWLQAHTPQGSRILTDRNDMILLRDRVVVGPRQVGATAFSTNERLVDTFLETSRVMRGENLGRVLEVARQFQTDFAVVPWRVDGAPYSDPWFSVVSAGTAPLRASR